jgi:hypothetical protein
MVPLATFVAVSGSPLAKARCSIASENLSASSQGSSSSSCTTYSRLCLDFQAFHTGPPSLLVSTYYLTYRVAEKLLKQVFRIRYVSGQFPGAAGRNQVRFTLKVSARSTFLPEKIASEKHRQSYLQGYFLPANPEGRPPTAHQQPGTVGLPAGGSQPQPAPGGP